MPATWNLRGLLMDRGITTASEFRRIVLDRTGYVLSIQAVCELLKKQPKMLRLKTGEAICDALFCCMSDFFEVKPQAASRSNRKKPNPLRSTDHSISEAGESTRNAGQEGMVSESPNVDFASFFPNAGKFSS